MINRHYPNNGLLFDKHFLYKDYVKKEIKEEVEETPVSPFDINN